MVTSANVSGSADGVQFSFAQDLNGRAQRVEIGIGGYRNPGEVIVASEWRAEYGEKLTGVSMFRMVLLQPGGGPSSSEIGDRRICVAVQRASKSRGDRVRESAAAYELGDGGDGRGSKQAVHTDIQALREVQEKFVVGNDPGLSRLATALVEYEVRINESFASDSHERWRAGIIVTSHLRGSSSIDPSQVFLLDYPDSWLEVAAGHVVDSSGIADQSTSPAAIFEDLKRDRLGRASEQLRLVCGLRLGEQTPLDRIRDLIDNVSGGQIVHDELARLLIH